jgi:dTDP-glucose pyrophosphorylase
MQAVVPAAGEGTRMRPLTAEKPKGLVEIDERPLLAHVFDTVADLAVTELVVVVGYRGDQIREHFGATYEGVPITYVRQPRREGLAHAVELAAPHVEGDFLLYNGDNICEANLAALRDRHRETDAVATALVEAVSRDRAARGGVFDLDDGDVVGVAEKPADPPSTVIPRGVWALDERVTHACALVQPGHTGEREFSAAIDLCLHAGWDLETVPLEGWCVNVNTPADVERVETRR